MTDRPITLVLDTSAILEFVRESMHVGEVISEVADDDAAVGLPLSCLVEAAQVAVDSDRLNLLAAHPIVELLADEPASWQMLSATYALVGGYASASAALHALDADASLLTRTPGRYAGVNAGGMVIPIED